MSDARICFVGEEVVRRESDDHGLNILYTNDENGVPDKGFPDSVMFLRIAGEAIAVEMASCLNGLELEILRNRADLGESSSPEEMQMIVEMFAEARAKQAAERRELEAMWADRDRKKAAVALVGAAS